MCESFVKSLSNGFRSGQVLRLKWSIFFNQYLAMLEKKERHGSLVFGAEYAISRDVCLQRRPKEMQKCTPFAKFMNLAVRKRIELEVVGCVCLHPVSLFNKCRREIMFTKL